MHYGSPIPITAFPDFDAVKDYVQTLEGEGFDFTSTSGHVLAQPSGTNPQRPDRQYVGPFYDPMVTFSYLAGMTRRIHFITGILILPAWPAALAAKQSAELAILSRGRFELGIGISWNAAEYRALGQDIRGRGKRIEEQIAVLRRLWSEPYVTFEGRYHTLDKVGLNRVAIPPIPIWMGSEFGRNSPSPRGAPGRRLDVAGRSPPRHPAPAPVHARGWTRSVEAEGARTARRGR